MKKLKFRVWHKTFGKFLTSDEWFIDFDGKLRFYDINNSEMYHIDENVYDIQQWTGLIDSNGMEIYDEDLRS